jgi:hypothetical protein
MNWREIDDLHYKVAASYAYGRVDAGEGTPISPVEFGRKYQESVRDPAFPKDLKKAWKVLSEAS